MSIEHWSEQERPREKLNPPRRDVAFRLRITGDLFVHWLPWVKCCGNGTTTIAKLWWFMRLLSASREEFCQGFGLGDAKYTQLQAVLEKSKRHLQE